MSMVSNIISIVGGIFMITIGLTGIFNKPFMDKLGFKKLGKKYYTFFLAIGIFILLGPLLNNIIL